MQQTQTMTTSAPLAQKTPRERAQNGERRSRKSKGGAKPTAQPVKQTTGKEDVQEWPALPGSEAVPAMRASRPWGPPPRNASVEEMDTIHVAAEKAASLVHEVAASDGGTSAGPSPPQSQWSSPEAMDRAPLESVVGSDPNTPMSIVVHPEPESNEALPEKAAPDAEPHKVVLSSAPSPFASVLCGGLTKANTASSITKRKFRTDAKPFIPLVDKLRLEQIPRPPPGLQKPLSTAAKAFVPRSPFTSASFPTSPMIPTVATTSYPASPLAAASCTGTPEVSSSYSCPSQLMANVPAPPSATPKGKKIPISLVLESAAPAHPASPLMSFPSP